MAASGDARRSSLIPRLWLVLAVGLALSGGAVGVGHAGDTDRPRMYWTFQPGVVFRLHRSPVDGLDVDRHQQTLGMSAGVDLGRHVSVEAAGTWAQTDLHFHGRAIGEYGAFTLIPQVRLRYPLRDGALTPYVLGGVGFAHNEYNDRKAPGVGVSIRADDTSVVGSAGAGLDYFVASNVALGAQATYVVSRGQEIEIQGRSQKANLDSLFVQASLRLHFPENAPGAETPSGLDTIGRPYVALQLGAAAPTHTDVGRHLEAETNYTGLDPFLGAALGIDLTPRLGFEATGGGYYFLLARPGFGKLAKYGTYLAVPSLRLRHPVLGGRVVPYALAGVGGAYGEVHDVKPRAASLRPRGTDVSVVGLIGAGLEYFVATNIAVGLELKYLVSRDHTVVVQGARERLNLDTLVTTGGVRIYFGRLFPR